MLMYCDLLAIFFFFELVTHVSTCDSMVYRMPHLETHLVFKQHQVNLMSTIKLRAVDWSTGGPPFTRKSLTRFPLPWFLAYVCACGGFLR